MLKISKRHSIKILKREDVYETSGSQPVKVYCDDFNFYVTKYKRNNKANDLLREFISASFLKIWKLGIPDYGFIHVRPEHVEKGFHPNIQPYCFDSLCFGSKFSRSFKDVTAFFAEMPSPQRRLLGNKDEFLIIALFDIWMSNEDRNQNNMNLMYDIRNKDRFVPIDHQFVFNSGNLIHGIYEISYNESILDSPLCSRLFDKKYLADKERIDNLENNFYLYVEECKQKVDKILALSPISWNVDVKNYSELLHSNLFDEAWIKNSWTTFITYLQYTSNK